MATALRTTFKKCFLDVWIYIFLNENVWILTNFIDILSIGNSRQFEANNVGGRRNGNFLLIFLQFYVYDFRFKVWRPANFWLSFKHSTQCMSLGWQRSTLVQLLAWCCQATSYYLNPCWQRPMMAYGTTGPQWVNQHDTLYLNES